MTTSERPSDILAHGTEEIAGLATDAVRGAIGEHRRLGNPIAVWRDDRVAWIPPEEIPPDQRDDEDGRGAAADSGV